MSHTIDFNKDDQKAPEFLRSSNGRSGDHRSERTGRQPLGLFESGGSGSISPRNPAARSARSGAALASISGCISDGRDRPMLGRSASSKIRRQGL